MRPEVISYAELAASSKAHKDGISKKRKSNQLSKGRSIGSGSSAIQTIKLRKKS